MVALPRHTHLLRLAPLFALVMALGCKGGAVGGEGGASASGTGSDMGEGSGATNTTGTTVGAPAPGATQAPSSPLGPISSVYVATCHALASGTAFAPQPGVTYILTEDLHQGLQIENDAQTTGTPLSQGPVTFTLDQLFTFESTGDGRASVRAYHSGKLLAGDANGSITLIDGNSSQSPWHVVSTDGNRFAFVQQSSGGCLTLPDGNQTLRIVADKKGWSGWDDQWTQIGATFRPTWFYDWGSTGNANQPARTEYVPMVWGYNGDPNALQALLAGMAHNPNTKQVLGYNEPDQVGQANLDVNTAIATWPLFEAVGKPYGSPAGAQATGSWMTTFMASVHDNVSFVTVHWYGNTSAAALQSYLQAVYNAYGRPIWVTEFAPADWNASSVDQIYFSQDDVTTFMQQVLPMLDSLPFVQRYAWFEATPTDAALGHSTLRNADGTLTAAGVLYANYPFVP